MPVEKRNLRSNKPDSSKPPAGGKGRSGSKSSGSTNPKPEEKPSATTSRARSTSQKSTTAQPPGDMTGDKKTTSSDSQKNAPNGSADATKKDAASKNAKTTKKSQDKDGDEEMTVVVPPSKSSDTANGTNKDAPEDAIMDDTEQPDKDSAEPPVDPKVKAAEDLKANFALLEKAVAQFDPRFTLRALRSISSIRKHLSADIIVRAIIDIYPAPTQTAIALLRILEDEDNFPTDSVKEWVKSKEASQLSSQKGAVPSKDILPEIEIYLSILVQVYFYDQKDIETGAKFSQGLIGHLRTLNRRTLDPLAARVYFYYSLFFEESDPLPPSPQAAVIEIRKDLMDALRTAALRKDEDTQATVLTLLVRNYLSTSHIQQADLLIAHTTFPDSAANNQVARWFYYLGRIRAIQLNYSDAHEHLIGATRKAPSSYKASGFYQAATKLLVVVELLMGDIPDRAIFRQPSLEKALRPYLQLVQAVSAGDVTGFQTLTGKHSATFRHDHTYTLILRLRQNVIKTGIRMMSLSYARISLRDMCLRLGLDSEESAEYIVAKAIRDGVIEATLDHEHGFMKSKDVGDVYSSQEPFDNYSSRIQACLALHDESVKAMRFPMNQHRLELKNAQEARERERELAKDIIDGEMDDDDGAGGDFEGL